MHDLTPPTSLTETRGQPTHQAMEEGVESVNVDIYDAQGVRVASRTIAVQDGFVNTDLELNGALTNGLYLVNITAGGATYSERLVIQK